MFIFQFYLPREDGTDPGIPNAIEDVCMEIDKAINATVQKNLRKLKDDCERVVKGINEAFETDKEKKKANSQNTVKVRPVKGWQTDFLPYALAICV